MHARVCSLQGSERPGTYSHTPSEVWWVAHAPVQVRADVVPISVELAGRAQAVQVARTQWWSCFADSNSALVTGAILSSKNQRESTPRIFCRVEIRPRISGRTISGV